MKMLIGRSGSTFSQVILIVAAIGTGQAWGEEGLSLTSDDPSIRTAARRRLESHVPLAGRLGQGIRWRRAE